MLYHMHMVTPLWVQNLGLEFGFVRRAIHHGTSVEEKRKAAKSSDSMYCGSFESRKLQLKARSATNGESTTDRLH
jgi:hypothetical protein